MAQRMKQENINIDLEYTPAQYKVFFESTARRRVVNKGRRLGFTRGCAQFIIETMLARQCAILWGDTVAANIRRYFDRYFMPILSQLPQSSWHWQSVEKTLKINNSVCDFRSADQPENWEGFGYNYVILNEAGIILKNRYLWENAVAPMLMDFEDSVAIIGGTPKGKGLYWELSNKALSDSNWETFTFSTFDNPFISKESTDGLIAELGGSGPTVDQEVYGKFVDKSSANLYQYDKVQASMLRECDTPATHVEVWGFDVGRQGDDPSVLAKRRDNHIYELKTYRVNDLMLAAEHVANEYRTAERKPNTIFIEINGLGAGLYDRLIQLGVPATPADVSMAALEEQLLNKRAEMHMNFAKAIHRDDFVCVRNNSLLSELSVIEYEHTEQGKIKIVSKKTLKKLLGTSTDHADACALTYFAPVIPQREDFLFENENIYTGGW